MLGEIIRLLGRGKWVITSHYLVPKILLVHKVIEYKARYGNVLVIDPQNQYTRTISMIQVSSLSENIVVADTYIPGRYEAIAVIEPETYNEPKNRNIIVTRTPGSSARIPRYYYKASISRAGEEYIARIRGEEIRFRIIGGDIVVEPALSPELREAYTLLRNAMMEYGELTVRDAVFILSRELGYTKDEARKILGRLTEKKYLRITRGLINI